MEREEEMIRAGEECSGGHNWVLLHEKQENSYLMYCSKCGYTLEMIQVDKLEELV